MSDDLNRRVFLKKSVTISAGVASALSLEKKSFSGKSKRNTYSDYVAGQYKRAAAG